MSLLSFLSKKTAVIVLTVLCTVALWAGPEIVMPSPFFLDPAAAAMGGAGIADPYGSILFNPARNSSGIKRLGLPWVAATVSNPIITIQQFRAEDWNGLAWSIPAGLVEIGCMQAGVDVQVPHFSLDLRGGTRLLAASYDNEEGGALMSDVMIETGGSLRLASGGSFLFNLKHRLDLGIGTGVDFSLWSEPVSAVQLSLKGVRDGVYSGTPLYTQCSVPLSLGASYWYRGIVGGSLTVRNDSLLVFLQNNFADNEAAFDVVKETPAALFAGSAEFNLLQGWTGDVGFYLSRRFGDFRAKLLVDFVDIAGYIREPIYWPSQLHAGLELTVNGISLRAGYNRGVTCGIGLDMKYAFFDVSLTKILFPMPNESKSTYLSMKMRFGF